MPNRLTRVPESPPPPLNNFTWLVRVADSAMKCFFSTPESGTLRTTWVTPATLWISYAAAIGWIVIALLGAFHYSVSIPPWVDLPIVGISSLLAISCAAIACTGTLQRIHSGDVPTSP